MRVFYSPEAVADLKRLREFIEVKNPQAARQAAASLLKGVGQLKTFPLLGAEVRQAPDPERIRDLIIGKYVVRYLVNRDEIVLLRIWHHREYR